MRPMSLSSSVPGSAWVRRLSISTRCSMRVSSAAGRARRVLDQVARGRAGGRLVEPADVGAQVAGDLRRRVGRADHVAAGDVEVVLEQHVTDIGGNASSTGPSKVSIRAIRVRARWGRTTTSSPARSTPPGDLPGVPAVVMVGVVVRAYHPLHRQPGGAEQRRSAATSTLSRYSSSGGPSYQGASSERLDDVVAVERRDRDRLHVRQPDASREGARSRARSPRTRRGPSRSGPSCSRRRRCAARRSSEAMKAWRLDCSTTPWRASISTIATSAVDAPVTMLRV